MQTSQCLQKESPEEACSIAVVETRETQKFVNVCDLLGVLFSYQTGSRLPLLKCVHDKFGIRVMCNYLG